MKRNLWMPVIAVLAVGAASGYALRPPETPVPYPATAPDPAPPLAADEAAERTHASRIFEMAATNPGLDYAAMKKFAEQSDALRERVHPEQGDLGHHVRERLGRVTVSEEEARSWFEEHRTVFGRRSFAESRHTVERLVAIQKVRAELGLN